MTSVERRAISKTGTGFGHAKLSEVLPVDGWFAQWQRICCWSADDVRVQIETRGETYAMPA